MCTDKVYGINCNLFAKLHYSVVGLNMVCYSHDRDFGAVHECNNLFQHVSHYLHNCSEDYAIQSIQSYACKTD